MERHIQLLQYTAVDRHFFEPYARRPIREDDFVTPLRQRLPPNWSLRRSDVWMHCKPEHAVLPAQGWKIHISSIASTAHIVLSIAAATLIETGTAFKFAVDLDMLAAINGKRWPRGGSGKFITVYPRDIDDFRQIIGDLHAALSGYVGPYVLTDRRYADSHVLHYRYGGIVSDYRILPDGSRQWLLTRPDETVEADERLPRFHLPEWLRDPFGKGQEGDGTSSVLLGAGRYRVHSALAFSSAGGIYLADDLDEGRRVVIKEARPHVGAHDGSAKDSLRKEFRLLRRLAAQGVAPQPVAYFEDWEHSFLVEEYLRGDTLRRWLGRRYPWLRTRATCDDVAKFLGEIVDVFTRLAHAVEAMHGAGVTVGDLSFHNIIVGLDGGVRLIDLEAGVEHGIDAPVDMHTPGFASASRSATGRVAAEMEDRYAFGANLAAAIMPVNAMLPLDRTAAMRFVRRVSEDMGYPDAMAATLASLMDAQPDSRPSPVTAMAELALALDGVATGPRPVPHRCRTSPAASDPADALFAYVTSLAANARADRFVPAGPEVFESHPWGIAHGAAGIWHAYQRGGRTLPDGLRHYLMRGIEAGRDRGNSLMSGDAGIAWLLFDAGERDRALSLLVADRFDDRIRQRAGLHEGMAGWGLARIKAWHETADATWLTSAVQAGDELLFTAIEDDNQTFRWPDGTQQPVGLAHGAAGIALFLLHLHVATGEARFIRAARAALAFDLAQSRRNPDGDPSWPMKVGGPTLFPYLRQGSAGILAVVARFLACTGDARYRDAILASEADLFRQHAISPGLFEGLAGIGETLLDLASFLPGRASIYRDAAQRVACGIEPFLVQRDEGLAVPGAELVRISCDFATGNAGVAAFFDRLWRGAPASFMLDEHLPATARLHQGVASGA
jgi:tRNA A-37 threonylcarbamoyl transferase component Bud32